MNEIVHKFLLVRDKFMSEMHLKQLGFTYSASGPFTKIQEIIEKFMQTWNTEYIFTKMILTKLVFNMIWLVVNRKIWIKEHNQIKV